MRTLDFILDPGLEHTKKCVHELRVLRASVLVSFFPFDNDRNEDPKMVTHFVAIFMATNLNSIDGRRQYKRVGSLKASLDNVGIGQKSV